MVSGLINANPVIYQKKERQVRIAPCDSDEYAVEPVDQQEIFDILSLWLYVMLLMSNRHCSHILAPVCILTVHDLFC